MESLLITDICSLLFFYTWVDNGLVMGFKVSHGFPTRNSFPPERGESLRAVGKERKFKARWMDLE